MTEQSRLNRISRASNDVLEATSFLFGANAPYIETLYAQWLENPDLIEPSWAAWFAELGQRGVVAFGRRPPLCVPSGPDADLIAIQGTTYKPLIPITCYQNYQL